MENPKTKVDIVQKIGSNFKLVERYEIDTENESAQKSMWKISYETNYPAKFFCDHRGTFQNCLECKHFFPVNEDKGIYDCARLYDRVSYKVMQTRLKMAEASGCKIIIY